MRHLLASLASIGSRPASAKARCDLCSSRPRTAISTCGFCHKVTCCCRGLLLWHGLRVLRVLGQAHEHAAIGARRSAGEDPGLSRLAGSPLQNSKEEAGIEHKLLQPSDRTGTVRRFCRNGTTAVWARQGQRSHVGTRYCNSCKRLQEQEQLTLPITSSLWLSAAVLAAMKLSFLLWMRIFDQNDGGARVMMWGFTPTGIFENLSSVLKPTNAAKSQMSGMRPGRKADSVAMAFQHFSIGAAHRSKHQHRQAHNLSTGQFVVD